MNTMLDSKIIRNFEDFLIRQKLEIIIHCWQRLGGQVQGIGKEMLKDD